MTDLATTTPDDPTAASPLTDTPSHLTPDDAQRLLDGATTPEGREALRDAARYLAIALLHETRYALRAHDVLTALARLVDTNDPEAATMARALLNGNFGDPEIASMHAEHGRLRTMVRGWAASTLAVGCLSLLDGPPMALRYVETELVAPGPDPRRVLVTVQRLERPSPNDCRLAAEARATAAEAEVERLRAELAALRAGAITVAVADPAFTP